jgi:dolichol kinase
LKRNTLLFGIIIGLIAPLLGMLGYYFWKFYPTYSLGDFFSIIFSNKTILSGLSTFALFANVILLTIYLNTRRDETAKGIFIISCVYAIAAIILKLFI